MFEGFTKARFDHDGVTIDYVTAGDGEPLLLLHGFPQHKAMWAKIAPDLARDFSVVVPDLRGYGDSSKPDNGPDSTAYSFRAMAEDQFALMRALGHERFHVIGHDRGGRVAHRMALDRPDTVQSITVMDIVPTHAVFMEGGARASHAYWHWYFLAQPYPFPERLIETDPDYFFETCMTGWGAAGLDDFDTEQLAEYRRCWRDNETIRAMCADYRAAWLVDLPMDQADYDQKVTCPVSVLYGADGVMAEQFDLEKEWLRRCTNVTATALPGGHFFVDTAPDETLAALRAFLIR